MSEPDLLRAVRQAASELSASTVSGRSGHKHHHHHHRRGRSETDLNSHASRGSKRSYGSGSYCSGYSTSKGDGMTLKDMQNHVQNCAMDRYIAGLQKEAQTAVKSADIWTKKVSEDKGEEESELQRRREMERSNQYLLRHQIEDNKQRRAEDRREFIEAASSHSFPLFTETFISLDEVNEYKKQVKNNFRQELNDQLICINTMKNLQKKQDMEYTLKKQKEGVFNMIKDRQAERSRLAEQGKEMVMSWERDIRLQHIKKAILSGKDIVRQTLGPGAVAACPSEVASIGRVRA